MKISIKSSKKVPAFSIWLPLSFLSSRFVCKTIAKHTDEDISSESLRELLSFCQLELKKHKKLRIVEVFAADGATVTITI